MRKLNQVYVHQCCGGMLSQCRFQCGVNALEKPVSLKPFYFQKRSTLVQVTHTPPPNCHGPCYLKCQKAKSQLPFIQGKFLCIPRLPKYFSVCLSGCQRSAVAEETRLQIYMTFCSTTSLCVFCYHKIIYRNTQTSCESVLSKLNSYLSALVETLSIVAKITKYLFSRGWGWGLWGRQHLTPSPI